MKAQDCEVNNNFEDQIAAEIKRQERIHTQLQIKRDQLETAEEELPLYVLQNDINEIDAAFKDSLQRVQAS